jgi:hypothetical protein
MKIQKSNILLTVFFSVATKCYSIPDPPEPRSIPPPVGDPVPIDSEIWILIASAIFLGIFYILRKQKLSA